MSRNGKILRAGDPWDEHYRGTHYHFNREGEVWWRVPATEARVLAVDGQSPLVQQLIRVKPEGGSFRITETGAVITKDNEDADDWKAIYVCEFVDPLRFEDLDIQGESLSPLDLWPAFYDGARYTFARGRLWWRNPVERLRQRVDEGLPDAIQKRLEQVKPLGGSIRITEHGKVLTLIQPQPLPTHVRSQYNALTNTQKRLIQVKVEGTDMIPIFLGDYLGGITLHPPERLTDPLSDAQEAEMMSFLKRYGDSLDAEEEDPLYFADDRPEEV